MFLDCKGLSKVEVFCALFNRAKPLGMGILHFESRIMLVEEAEKILASSLRGYFDYVEGRVMKIGLSSPQIDTGLYDRDNGQGAAQQAVDDYLITKPCLH